MLRRVARRSAAKARCVACARGARDRLRPRESSPTGLSYRVAKSCRAGYLEATTELVSCATAAARCCTPCHEHALRCTSARRARPSPPTREVPHRALSPRRAGYLEATTEVDAASPFTHFSLGGGPEENTSRQSYRQNSEI